ncbi:MAG: DUF364 domain-containing protein [Burkholderiales bacterium]|nr:DUF364 domain-containing protein [Burkholderiales bacterium]
MGVSERVIPGGILGDIAAQVRAALGPRLDELAVERAVLGLFFTGVKLSDGSGGICATLTQDMPEAVCCPSSSAQINTPGKLRGRKAVTFLDDLVARSPLKRILAVAVLSALCATARKIGPPAGYTIRRGVDALDAVEVPPDAHVVIVGAFVPVIKAMKARGRSFCILEKDPATLKADELPFYAPAEAAPVEVPKADVLFITGTTLINDTLEGILASAKAGARVVVVGPTASLAPEALFRRSVSIVGGVDITDPDLLLDLLAEGGSGYHFFGRAADRIVMAPAAA